MASRWGNNGKSDRLYLEGSKITANGNTTMKLNMFAPWKKRYDQPKQHIKNQRHYFANKGRSSQGYGFSSGHVWM